MNVVSLAAPYEDLLFQSYCGQFCSKNSHPSPPSTLSRMPASILHPFFDSSRPYIMMQEPLRGVFSSLNLKMIGTGVTCCWSTAPLLRRVLSVSKESMRVVVAAMLAVVFEMPNPARAESWSICLVR